MAGSYSVQDHQRVALKAIAPGLTSAEVNVGALLMAWRAANSLQSDAAYLANMVAFLVANVQPSTGAFSDIEERYWQFRSGLGEGPA